MQSFSTLQTYDLQLLTLYILCAERQQVLNQYAPSASTYNKHGKSCNRCECCVVEVARPSLLFLRRAHLTFSYM